MEAVSRIKKSRLLPGERTTLLKLCLIIINKTGFDYTSQIFIQLRLVLKNKLLTERVHLLSQIILSINYAARLNANRMEGR